MLWKNRQLCDTYDIDQYLTKGQVEQSAFNMIPNQYSLDGLKYQQYHAIGGMPVFLVKNDFLPFVGPNLHTFSYFQPIFGLYNPSHMLFPSNRMLLVSLATV